MTQVTANIFERVHLVIIGAPPRNERVTQRSIATRHFNENWRLFGPNFIA
jgi:hypothetical protein